MSFKTILILLLSCHSIVVFAQWSFSQTCNTSVWSMAVKDNQVLAGAAMGIYFTEDNGDTWLLKNCPASYVRTIITRDNALYFNSDFDGVFKSSDNGDTWVSINTGIANPAQAWSLTQNDSLLILGTSGSFAGDSAEIYISSDLGEHWSKVFSLGQFDVFYSFASAGDDRFAGFDTDYLYRCQ